MVTDEMVEKAERVYWDTSNDPEGSRDMRAALEAALSAAEPVMYVSEKQLPQCVGHYVPSRKTAEGNFQLALYRAPPEPSVAVKAEKTTCKNCGSDLNSWFTSNRVNLVAVDGRLKSNEISCDFVLGCEECSETLRVVPADEIASQMNAALYAQVQDVAGLESNPVTLRWWCQQLLDIIDNYDISHDSCDEEIALINDIRSSVDPAAPAKQEGDTNE